MNSLNFRNRFFVILVSLTACSTAPQPIDNSNEMTTNVPERIINYENLPVYPWNETQKLEIEKNNSCMFPKTNPPIQVGNGVQMSKLKRAFVYPRAARRLGISGVVNLIFEIDKDGKLINLWKKDNKKVDPVLADEIVKQVHDLPLSPDQAGHYGLCLDFKLTK